MKIDRLRIRGFRGFSDEFTIYFSPTITTIYAPNSYGKTSLSEALEWLFYGTTCRVSDGADVGEYKGSLRNCHVRPECECFVEAVMTTDTGSSLRLKRVLTEDDVGRSFLDDVQVAEWPYTVGTVSGAGRPFITQHALKTQLLASPSQRFTSFSRLLGLDRLDSIQQSIVQLCTKPAMPQAVQQASTQVDALLNMVTKQPSLTALSKLLQKGEGKLSAAREELERDCLNRVPPGTSSESLQAQLLKLRDEKVAGVFSGHVRIPEPTSPWAVVHAGLQKKIEEVLSSQLTEKLLALKTLKGSQDALDEREFLRLGLLLLGRAPTGTCPLCGMPVGVEMPIDVSRRHAELSTKTHLMDQQAKECENVVSSLDDLQQRLSSAIELLLSRTRDITAARASLPVLEALLANEQLHYTNICGAIGSIQSALTELDEKQRTFVENTQRLSAKTKPMTASEDDVLSLRSAALALLDGLESANSAVASWSQQLDEAEHVLSHQLDKKAQTEDISVMIQCLENWELVSRVFKVRSIVASLTTMKRTTEQYASSKAEEIVSQQFTQDVQEWYSKITTPADPEVGFSGFCMAQNADGRFRARNIQVKAVSFGAEMKSAVSCLSESKLNALGLAMSISTYLKSNTWCDFLVIDDPIQSLDASHETQFIGVIRSLSLDHHRQVILLSHNSDWLTRVRDVNQDMDGSHYEFTGFAATGPTVSEKSWCPWKHRLDAARTIATSNTTDTVRLEHAEEEIRICVGLIVAELVRRVRGENISTRNLGSAEVRRHLMNCDVPDGILNRILTTFDSTDPAHHAQPGYAPDRSRIQTYCSWCMELANWGGLNRGSAS